MAFCDWLSVYQEHSGGGLPIINNGRVVAIDADGTIDWTTEKDIEHEGSFDTKIKLKCDGHRVTLKGNVGRFGRPDNVWGYSVVSCIDIANRILADFKLPPFTSGRRTRQARSENILNTGATITRVDLTRNYLAGSPIAAARLCQYMAGQGGVRAMPKSYGQSGVSWNEGSKYWYSKIYVKADSLGPHIDPHLAAYIRDLGMVRHEISLKSRYLAQHGLRYIDTWNGLETDTMENVIYGRFADILSRNTVHEDPFTEIPGRLGDLALAWRSGKDIWGDTGLSIRTKQRHRRALLPYGIDIKFPCNVSTLNMRVEVIQLQEAKAPEWYWGLSILPNERAA